MAISSNDETYSVKVIESCLSGTYLEWNFQIK